MKVACESCGAKYTIADEKVEGKTFKIRCKKCSHVIVASAPAPVQPAARGGVQDLLATAAGHEGSGLVDIRSIASAYLGSSRPTPGMAAAPRVGSIEDLPTFATPVFAEPAMLIPRGAAGGNRMLGVLFAAVGVMTVLAGFLLYLALASEQVPARAHASPEPAPPPPVTASPAPASHAPIALATTEPPPAAPPLQAETPVEPAPVARPRARPTATPRPRAAPETPAPRATAIAPAPRATAIAPAPTAGKTCVLDEVGCLLAERRPACCSIYGEAATRDPKPTPKPDPIEPTELPESLTRADVTAAMAKVESRVRACSATSAAKGKVLVEIKVAPAGNVTAAAVKESPDAALGNCVASAVGKASFARTRSAGRFQLPYRF